MPLGLLLLFLSALACILVPEQAFAWGPGAHLVTGNWLLQNLTALPAEVAAVIMQSPCQYLHGLLGADIFIGKGCKAKKGHSHNWESGFALLSNAADDRQTAYAYGYLCHLAADTVAHNVFVPGLLHTAPGGGKAAHIYLEGRADSMIEWSRKDALALFKGRESSAALSLLRRSMHRKPLPFWFYARIYQGSIALGGSTVWRGSIARFDRLIREQEKARPVLSLLELSTNAMLDVLRKGSRSRVLALDPIGAEALALATIRTRKAHGLVRSGIRKQIFRRADRLPDKNVLKQFIYSHSTTIEETKRPPSSQGQELIVPPILEALPSICGRKKD